MGLLLHGDQVIAGLSPLWRIVIVLALVVFSVLSVYGRINLDFGDKFFSRVTREQIRTNKFHIFQYTVMPVLVALVYLVLLIRYSVK